MDDAVKEFLLEMDPLEDHSRAFGVQELREANEEVLRNQDLAERLIGQVHFVQCRLVDPLHLLAAVLD